MAHPNSNAPAPASHPEPQSGGGFRASALYRLLLLGPAPRGVRLEVPDPWPGDLERGRELLNFAFRHAGELHHVSSAAEVPVSATMAWRAWFHSFAWLKDLQALDDGEAPYFAREWLSTWMDDNSKWSPVAWAPEVTAARLIHWVRAWSFLVRADGAGAFETKLRQTAGRDARHILRTLPPSSAGYARLATLKGQTFVAVTLLGGEHLQSRVLNRLEQEVDAQVLPDGGHVERNPERLAQALADLVELKALLVAAHGQVPAFLQNALDRAAPMLRALRHPDGGLALFNGSSEDDAGWLDQVLAQSDPAATPPQRAPYAGFQRIDAGTAHIIMDCGKPGGPGRHHHAGTLSFELSTGAQRLVVNCGARDGAQDPWRTALAATAAHSTLSVNDTSSAAFALDGTLRRGAEHVTCERQDTEDGILIESSHDGYMNAFGLTHHRALFVLPDGSSVRGEDRLTGTGGEYFTIRFHLHPGVQASLQGDGTGVLLRFGAKHKETWRMRTSLGEVKLEDSVYLGRPGETRRTQQIVISGPLSGNGALVKWAFNREGA